MDEFRVLETARYRIVHWLDYLNLLKKLKNFQGADLQVNMFRSLFFP
jgi:hypothetical protein